MLIIPFFFSNALGKLTKRFTKIIPYINEIIKISVGQISIQKLQYLRKHSLAFKINTNVIIVAIILTY